MTTGPLWVLNFWAYVLKFNIRAGLQARKLGPDIFAKPNCLLWASLYPLNFTRSNLQKPKRSKVPNVPVTWLRLMPLSRLDTRRASTPTSFPNFDFQLHSYSRPSTLSLSLSLSPSSSFDQSLAVSPSNIHSLPFFVYPQNTPNPHSPSAEHTISSPNRGPNKATTWISITSTRPSVGANTR